MVFNPLPEVPGSSLEWREPKALKDCYELRSGRDLLGALSFRSSWGTLATAETQSSCWTLKREGFLNTRITVRERGSHENVGLFLPRLLGDGSLSLRDGESFRWAAKGFWGRSWSFLDGAGRPLMTFSAGLPSGKVSELFKTQATVSLTPEPSSRARLPLLCCLGFYLIILQNRDAAASLMVYA